MILEYLRDRRKINSKILTKLKNDDWVLGKLGEHSISSEPVLHQLWQVENLERVDDFPTLYYDYKTKNGIVYTNTRVIKENTEHPLINCLGIVEIVPEELVEIYINKYNLFLASKYPLGDEYKLEFNI